MCRKNSFAAPNPSDSEVAEKSEGEVLRKSARQRSLGRFDTGSRRRIRSSKRRGVAWRSMSSDAASSSEETKSDSETMAAGMINLAIVCAHVQKKAAEEVLPAGNFASYKVDVLLERLDYVLESSGYFFSELE